MPGQVTLAGDTEKTEKTAKSALAGDADKAEKVASTNSGKPVSRSVTLNVELNKVSPRPSSPRSPRSPRSPSLSPRTAIRSSRSLSPHSVPDHVRSHGSGKTMKSVKSTGSTRVVRDDHISNFYTLEAAEDGAFSHPANDYDSAEEAETAEVSQARSSSVDSALLRRAHQTRRTYLEGAQSHRDKVVVLQSLSTMYKAQPAVFEMRGWVEKASPHWFTLWQPRWLVLRDKQLRWYEDEAETTCLGMLDFDLVSTEVVRIRGNGSATRELDDVEEANAAAEEKEQLLGNESITMVDVDFSYGAAVEKQEHSARSDRKMPKPRTSCGGCGLMDLIFGEPPGTRFLLCPVQGNRAFQLRLPTQAQTDVWVDALCQHIEWADKERRHDFPLNELVEGNGAWWKILRISPETFENLADTGDVLLFRSRGIGSQLIRSAGRSRFDHVALVLRLPEGLCLLEATGNEGVAFCFWNYFMAQHWQTLYPELALRRVHFDRTHDRLFALQEFCNKVVGKPYGLDARKLIRWQSSSGTINSDGSSQASRAPVDSDFFCSQLVADALKAMGVLPRGKSSTRFWPGHFSAAKGPIDCMPGCRFESEDLTIDFRLGDVEGRAQRFPLPKAAEKATRDATINF